MALPPPDQPPKKGKKKSSPAMRTFVKKNTKPPKVKGDWDKGGPNSGPMPGPKAPDIKDGNGVLPPKATKNGAYFLPGFGDVARAKNRKRYRDRHAFNPGPGGTNSA